MCFMKLGLIFFACFVVILTLYLAYSRLVHSTNVDLIATTTDEECIRHGLFLGDTLFELGDTPAGKKIRIVLAENGISLSPREEQSIVAVKHAELLRFEAPEKWKINYTYSTALLRKSKNNKVYFYKYDRFYRNVLLGQYPIEFTE